MSARDERELLTVGEVARQLGQSASAVRRKIAAGTLPVIRLGDGPAAPVRVDVRDLDEWRTAHRTTGGAA